MEVNTTKSQKRKNIYRRKYTEKHATKVILSDIYGRNCIEWHTQKDIKGKKYRETFVKEHTEIHRWRDIQY